MSPSAENVRRARLEVLACLRDYVDVGTVATAWSSCDRLLNALSCSSSAPLARHRALLAYGGGKDSSYMVAYVRLMQLLLYQEHGTTFQLRVVTSRHAGMPVAVMENIDRTYRALGLYDDPDVELLMVDGHDVSTFDATRPLPDDVVRRNRLDVLMTGHRCHGDGRPTFCNSCNLSMIGAFATAAAYGGGVDAVVTGDSTAEQKAYMLWVRRLARQMGLPPGNLTRFDAFVQTADGIARSYYSDIYLSADSGEVGSRRMTQLGNDRNPIFFSIYEDTAYRSGDHWDLLTEFLGFRFDDLSFSFTESDCANPALMAHLRGLKAERVFGTGYAAGIEEYRDFAITLMQAKDFPQQLVTRMRQRYSSRRRIEGMRRRLDEYARDAFGLTQEHLVCMLYSPFIDEARNLRPYLEAERPDLLEHMDEVHAVLVGRAAGPPALVTTLTKVSGLSADNLRVLYRSSVAATGTAIGLVLAGDPHKAVIRTKHAPDGPSTLELISGR